MAHSSNQSTETMLGSAFLKDFVSNETNSAVIVIDAKTGNDLKNLINNIFGHGVKCIDAAQKTALSPCGKPCIAIADTVHQFKKLTEMLPAGSLVFTKDILKRVEKHAIPWNGHPLVSNKLTKRRVVIFSWELAGQPTSASVLEKTTNLRSHNAHVATLAESCDLMYITTKPANFDLDLCPKFDLRILLDAEAKGIRCVSRRFYNELQNSHSFDPMNQDFAHNILTDVNIHFKETKTSGEFSKKIKNAGGKVFNLDKAVQPYSLVVIKDKTESTLDELTLTERKLLRRNKAVVVTTKGLREILTRNGLPPSELIRVKFPVFCSLSFPDLVGHRFYVNVDGPRRDEIQKCAKEFAERAKIEVVKDARSADTVITGCVHQGENNASLRTVTCLKAYQSVERKHNCKFTHFPIILPSQLRKKIPLKGKKFRAFYNDNDNDAEEMIAALLALGATTAESTDKFFSDDILNLVGQKSKDLPPDKHATLTMLLEQKQICCCLHSFLDAFSKSENADEAVNFSRINEVPSLRRQKDCEGRQHGGFKRGRSQSVPKDITCPDDPTQLSDTKRLRVSWMSGNMQSANTVSSGYCTEQFPVPTSSRTHEESPKVRRTPIEIDLDHIFNIDVGSTDSDSLLPHSTALQPLEQNPAEKNENATQITLHKFPPQRIKNLNSRQRIGEKIKPLFEELCRKRCLQIQNNPSEYNRHETTIKEDIDPGEGICGYFLWSGEASPSLCEIIERAPLNKHVKNDNVFNCASRTNMIIDLESTLEKVKLKPTYLQKDSTLTVVSNNGVKNVFLAKLEMIPSKSNNFLIFGLKVSSTLIDCVVGLSALPSSLYINQVGVAAISSKSACSCIQLTHTDDKFKLVDDNNPVESFHSVIHCDESSLAGRRCKLFYNFGELNSPKPAEETEDYTSAFTIANTRDAFIFERVCGRWHICERCALKKRQWIDKLVEYSYLSKSVKTMAVCIKCKSSEQVMLLESRPDTEAIID